VHPDGVIVPVRGSPLTLGQLFLEHFLGILIQHRDRGQLVAVFHYLDAGGIGGALHCLRVDEILLAVLEHGPDDRGIHLVTAGNGSCLVDDLALAIDHHEGSGNGSIDIRGRAVLDAIQIRGVVTNDRDSLGCRSGDS
jgi:hypothetical protein